MSKELTTLYNHFKENCSVKVEGKLEERQYPHWKRLMFHSLDCEQMDEISRYIKNTFSNVGKYSHKLPQLCVYNGFLCLTVDIAQIKEKL